MCGFSGVPTARGAFSVAYPPVNRRAIFGGPCGTVRIYAFRSTLGREFPEAFVALTRVQGSFGA